MRENRSNPFGLGVSEVDDTVWITSHATGSVVFHGTASQLAESPDLMRGLTANQIAELEISTATA